MASRRIPTAVASNQAVEGNNPTNTTVNPTTRVFNYCEIAQYAFQISGTQQAVNTAGRANEMAFQLVKYGLQMKRDMESALSRTTALRLRRDWHRASFCVARVVDVVELYDPERVPDIGCFSRFRHRHWLHRAGGCTYDPCDRDGSEREGDHPRLLDCWWKPGHSLSGRTTR
jgi:hypothetical protein